MSRLHVYIVKAHWMSLVCASGKPRLRIPTNQKVIVVCAIMIHLIMGESNLLVVFWNLKNLAISVLFRMFFIDRFVNCIFSRNERQYHTSRVRY